MERDSKKKPGKFNEDQMDIAIAREKKFGGETKNENEIGICLLN